MPFFEVTQLVGEFNFGRIFLLTKTLNCGVLHDLGESLVNEVRGAEVSQSAQLCLNANALGLGLGILGCQRIDLLRNNVLILFGEEQGADGGFGEASDDRAARTWDAWIALERLQAGL